MKHLKKFEIFNKKYGVPILPDNIKFKSEIEEHDTVKLKDGRIGTIIHIYPDNENFAIEITETDEPEVDTINKNQIEKKLK